MSDQPVGRARGRGRGQQQAPVGSVAEQMARMTVSPEQSGASSRGGGNGNGNGEESGGAMRGRGGFYRRIEPETRPTTASFGNKGQPIRLLANYFHMTRNPQLQVYQYHVAFEPPEIDRRFKRRMVFNHKELFNDTLIYDGEATIFALNNIGESEEFVEQLPEVTVKVVITRAKEVREGEGEDPRDTTEMIRVYNTQMRKFLGRYLKLTQIRQFLYDPSQKIPIPSHKIDVWPGVQTAINKHFGGILCCCEPIFKVVRTDSALELLLALRTQGPSFKEEAIKQLVGAVVMTPYNNRTYRIDDIEWRQRPESQMPGDQRTYVEYYRERYRIDIRDPKQPLLLAKCSIRDQIRLSRRAGGDAESPRPTLLVPELCVMTGLSDSMKNDNNLKREMAQHIRPDPAQRVRSIRRFMQRLTSCAEVQEDMNKWGTRYQSELVRVEGRVLPGEAVLGRGENRFVYDHKSDDFVAQIRSKPMRSTVTLNNWVIFATERDREHVDKLMDTMRKVCQPMGIQVSRPTVKLMPNPQTRSFIDEGKRLNPDQTDVVVIISPDDRADRYCALKKLFCCEVPIVSQVVLARNMRKQGFMSICTKVAIQVACKMGAEPWCMDIPAKGIMVVGFDTYHDTQAVGGARKSVGGFVSSLNPSLSRWYSRANQHGTAEELSKHFCANMTMALKAYFKRNQRFPEWVVVYRDGVGEGQIAQVYENERADIVKAINAVHTDIKLTFVIVTKRVNTRLFVPGPNDQFRNPPPGTVVDTVITRPSRFDFFLVSQSVRQGTVSPTHYNIIHDDTGRSANIHQMLAYKLTHMYFNWAGCISVPAPCQYAHKLAFLSGTALHREAHPKLSELLFYL